MALSLQKSAGAKDYILNNFKFHKFGEDEFLLTNNHGGWVLLDKQEFDLFKSHRVEEDSELFSILKDKGFVITKNSFEGVSESYRMKHAFLFHGPTLHIIVPTFRCNMRCLYCHSKAKTLEDKKFDMDIKTSEKIADFILQTPTDKMTVEFQGGDCLLNYEVVEYFIKYILDKAGDDRDIRFSVVSNLTTIDKEGLDRLSDILYKPEHGIISLNTSLDGPKEIHNKNRPYVGGEGSYEDVIEKISMIRGEYGYDFNLAALSTITKYTIEGEGALIDEYKRRGFKTIWLRPLNNLGYARNVWKKIGYTSQEFIEFWKSQLDYIMDLNKKGFEMEEGWAKIISSKILREKHVPFVDLSSPCGAGTQQLLYNHKGEIFTCDEAKIHSDFKLGNVRENTYPEIFKSKILYNMIDVSSQLSIICDSCEWQPYCGLCPVLNFASQGNIIPKIPENERCKMYKSMIETIFEKILFSEEDRQIFKNWQESLATFLNK